MRSKLLALFPILVLLVANPISCYSQVKGSWSIGWSLGFTTKGGAFVKYYVDDGVALEVFGGSFPHIWHVGTEVSVHPLMLADTKYRNFAVTAGYSWFGGFGPHSSFNGRGINFGGEFSFTTKQSDLFNNDGAELEENFFASIGGTYVIEREVSIHDTAEYEKSDTLPDTTRKEPTLIPYFEGGVVVYDN